MREYQKHHHRKKLIFFGLIAATMLIGFFSISQGPLKLTSLEVCSTLLHRFFPGSFSCPNELAERTIWYMRLPRLLAGIVAGMNLGIAGAVMQPVLRNPMASPFTLGISSGAGFGAALAILFARNFQGGVYVTVGSAFAFSLASAFIILGLSGRKGSSPQNMILIGIALSYLFQAGTTVMQYFSDSWAVTEIVFWMVGTLAKSTWNSLSITMGATLLCVPYIIILAKNLNVMTAGDDVCQSLGVPVNKTRITLLIAASLLTATTICFTGTIGFIGLVAPHISRMMLGSDNRFIVPAAGIIGGGLLSLADMVAMNLIAPVVIPIGVMTAFTGVPLFLYLVMKNRGEFWR